MKRGRKILAVAMVICMAIGVIGWHGEVENVRGAEVYGDYEYEVLSDGTIKILKYKGAGSILEIPSQIDGKQVTNIGQEAFFYCKNLTEVIIPDSVNTIGREAFYGCDSLEKIAISNSVSSVGEYAFAECKKLREANLPEGIRVIPLGMFMYCESLENVKIPSSVIQITNNAFNGCKGLTEMAIPEGVAKLEIYTFKNCENLQIIRMPESIKNIDKGVFYGCISLKHVYYSGTKQQWESVDISQEGTDSTGGWTGSENKYLSEAIIHLNDGTEINGSNEDFEYMMLDDGTIEITKYNGSEAVVEVPAQINEKRVTSIGEGAFNNKERIEEVHLPASVTNIGNYVFATCQDLNKINLDSVTHIGDYAFTTCTGLYEIRFSDSLKELGDYAFGNCVNLTEIRIPEGVTSIGEGCFYDCERAAQIVIPDTVTEIGDSAFFNCRAITQMVIPNSLTEIGCGVFASCTGLKQVEIPVCVMEIGKNAFKTCSNLTDVYYDGTKEQWNGITIDAGSGLEEERITIHFKEPDETAKDYEYNILDSNAIEITKYTGSDTAVTIPAQIDGKNVIKITEKAFNKIENLTQVKIPACLTDLEKDAFYECTNLTVLDADAASENYSSIDGVLFNKAKTELIRFPEGKSGEYTIPSGVVSIRDYAFHKCGKLTEVTVPDGVITIGNHAFAYSSNIKRIDIPIGVTQIKGYTFQGCKSLEEFVVPEGVTTIDIGVFNYCQDMKSLTIPVSTVQIHRNFFAYGLVVPYSLKDVYYGGTKEQWEQIEVPGYSEGSASVSKKLLLDYLNATVHFKNGPIILPEEPTQPEVKDPKEELDRLKANGSFQLEEFRHFLTEEQIGIFEDYLYTWLAQVNYAYQYEGSSEVKELVMKKAGIDPDGDFASGMEQAITHISVDTAYGKKTFEITMGLSKPDGSGSLYPGYGVMHYEILEKNGIPSDLPASGQIVRNYYTDMGAFVESVKKASEDSLHGVYQWQQLENEVTAGILIDKTVAEIVGNKNGSFSDGTFTIYAKPLFAYSKIVKISCPVDVHVYGMDGKEAGSIVNNKPSGGSQQVRLDVDGETKTVYLAGDDYYLNLHGTGTGTMKYEVEEIANEEVRRNVQFLELQLKNDMLYEGYVFRPLNIDRGLYALRTVEKDGTGGEVYRADEDSYQALFKKVQGLSLSQKNTSLESDHTIQLSASHYPLDASNPNLRWATDNESVVKVDKNGLVTAVGSGRATVTVSTKDGSFLKQFCVIDVAERGNGSGSGDGSSGNGSGSNNGSNGNGSASNNGSNGNNGSSGNNGSANSNGNGASGSGNSSGNSGSANSSGNGSNGTDQSLVVVNLHYVLQFDTNGGTNLSRRTMTLLADDYPGIMPKVQRKDYMFDGWYTRQEGGTRISGDEPLTEAATLYAQWTKAKAPAKVLALTLKSRKKGQLQASFQKAKGAAGYQVSYSGSKKFTSAKTKEIGASVKSKMITGLKAGKKYYVRVRAYCLDSAGNQIFGNYSAVKSIKV